MLDISVVVLGAGGVGKSCLTIQYVQGHFVDKYDATIEDVYRKPVDIDGLPAVLTVVDTAGQDTFGAMRDQYMLKGQGFVLVYSITDTESFAQAQKIYTQLRRVRGSMKPTPCVLVGNKVDQETYRAVERERGRQLATEMMRCPFLEVTAKDHKMSEEVFEVLVRTIRNGSAPPPNTSTSPSGQASSAAGNTGPDGGAGRDAQRTGTEGPPAVAAGAAMPAEGGAAAAAPRDTPSTSRKKKKRCTLL